MTSRSSASASTSTNTNIETTSTEMPAALRVDPTRLATLTANLASIHSRITAAAAAASASSSSSSSSSSPSTSRRRNRPPRLVAVSKLKPATDILALALALTATQADTSHAAGGQRQRHFGENYVQELLEKSKILWDAEIEPAQKEEEDQQQQQQQEEKEKEKEKGCQERHLNDSTREDFKAPKHGGVGRRIRWHFIGGLQSNKATQLARDVRGLWCVESVDSEKKARGLAKGWSERSWRRRRRREREEHLDDNNKDNDDDDDDDDDDDEKLRVMIQVNTSGEENKSGVEPNSDELLKLARCIREECADNLKLQGLMTIGAIARSRAAKEGEENQDFVKLKEVRDWLVKELGLGRELEKSTHDGEPPLLELSMGMSEDFESAIRLGSDEVRIGSTIFGERPPKSEAKVL